MKFTFQRCSISCMMIVMSIFWSVVLIVSGYLSYVTAGEMSRELGILVNKNIPLAEIASDIGVGLNLQQSILHSGLNNDNIAVFKDSSREVRSALSKLEKLVAEYPGKDAEAVKAGLQSALERFRSAFNEYNRSVMSSYENGISSNYMENLKKLQPPLSEFKNGVRQLNEQSKTNAALTESNSLKKFAAGVAAAIVIGFLFSFFIVGTVKSKLSGVKSRMESIATGDADLTRRIAVEGRTEVDEIAGFSNTFIERMQNLIQEVKEKEILVAQYAEQVGEMSEGLAATAVQGQAQSEEVTSTAEQISEQISGIAAAMEEMTATVSEIAQNTTQTTHKSDEALMAINKAQDVVKKLSDASSQIGEMSNLIGTIAEQTNLLALNATIEAARAGETGKGFAVVANEVKDLAKQTGDAVSEIEANVNDLQSHVDAVMDITSEVSEVVTNLNDMASSVAAAVEEQTATTNEISMNMQNASTQVNDLANMSAGIKEAASQTASGSEQAKSTAAEMKDTALALKNTLDVFKT